MRAYMLSAVVTRRTLLFTLAGAAGGVLAACTAEPQRATLQQTQDFGGVIKSRDFDALIMSFKSVQTGDPFLLDGVGQGLRDVLLSDDIAETLRPILSRDDLVTHGIDD